MEVYKNIFASVDAENSGEISIVQLQNSIENSEEKDFGIFINDEITKFASDSINLTIYQGKGSILLIEICNKALGRLLGKI